MNCGRCSHAKSCTTKMVLTLVRKDRKPSGEMKTSALYFLRALVMDHSKNQ